MSKIVKNNTASPLVFSDVGITIATSSQYTIPAQDYWIWAASDDVVTHVGSGDATINDGSGDLSISDGIDLIKGIYQKNRIIGNTDSTLIGNISDALKVSQVENTDQIDHRIELLDFQTDIIRQLKIITAHLAKISDLELDDGDEEDY